MADASSSATAPRRNRFRNWFLIIMAAAMLVAVVEAAGIFFLSKEAKKLQLAINTDLDFGTSTKFQLSVGPGLLGVGRMAAHWIDDIPTEVHQVMGAVKEASVGVYELDRSPTATERGNMMRITDQRLGLKGWQRIVAVNEKNETVLIYTPIESGDEAELRVCIAVCDGRDLVVVSATTSIESLSALTNMHRGELRDILHTPRRKGA